jgi:hypothetical protein
MARADPTTEMSPLSHGGALALLADVVFEVHRMAHQTEGLPESGRDSSDTITAAWRE